MVASWSGSRGDSLRAFCQLVARFGLVAIAVGCRAVPKPPPAEAGDLVDLRGLIHFHTENSHDSGGDLDDVLDVAHAAGADFVAITDHTPKGDPEGSERWQGRHQGVEVLVGAELSDEGHLVWLGDRSKRGEVDGNEEWLRAALDGPAVAIVAHPERDRAGWERFDLAPLITHLEIGSLSSQLRASILPLALRLPWVLLAPTPAIASVLRRPDAELARWDQLLRDRPVTAIGSLDVHFRWFTPEVPLGRLVTTHVLVDPAARSADDLLRAIEVGRCYVAFEASRPASGFRFYGRAGDRHLEMGDFSSGLASLHVAVPFPATVSLWCGGRAVQRRKVDHTTVFEADEPGAYRIEVERSGRPWIYSNPIYLTR